MRGMMLVVTFWAAIGAATSVQADTVLRADLISGQGTSIGEVQIWQGGNGMVIEIAATNLPPGMHGTHLHAVGDCSDIGVFKASGGHIEGTGGHGFAHAAGAHGGDLPNVYAHHDGTARVDFFTTLVTLDDLTDEDGAALVMHAAPDDYSSQPTGGSGARIACAAFEPRD